MFRGLFKTAENFLHLLERCRNRKLDLNAEDLVLFDLNTEYTSRKRRNDVSFITRDNRLIILVEHQSTISANIAFKLLLYYFELIQLWVKQNKIDIHARVAIPTLPMPEFYVVYNGKEKLKDNFSSFELKHSNINISVQVAIIDISFDSLKETEASNALAGYSYFYKKFEEYTLQGINRDNAFMKSREDCIKAGYLKGFIEKEDLIVMYSDILDYDAQLRSEGREEGREALRGETAIEMLKEGFDTEKIAKCLKMPVKKVEELMAKVG
jgi:predicted transposase/invertase (TIGR01784 family)